MLVAHATAVLSPNDNGFVHAQALTAAKSGEHLWGCLQRSARSAERSVQTPW